MSNTQSPGTLISTDHPNAGDSGCGRRDFLARAALLTAGVSATALLPNPGTAAPLRLADAKPGSCPDIKTPMADVKDKVAFVTGGASGIGLGVVKVFVDAGMKVVIADLSAERIQEALAYFAGKSQRNRVHGIRVNVTDRPGLEQAAAETVKVFGKVHVLVNNAGVTIPPTVSQTSYQDWDWLMNININGPFNGIRVFLPLIQAHGEGGQIVTTSSILGLFTGQAEGAYVTSKFAVTGMMEALRSEFAGTDIGVSVFCPGLVISNIGDTSRSALPQGTKVSVDAAAAEQERKLRHNPEFAMDPVEAGRMVLRGIRNNDMYILTHPEFEQAMQDRQDALSAAVPRDVTPPEGRAAMARTMSTASVYVAETKRKRCRGA